MGKDNSNWGILALVLLLLVFAGVIKIGGTGTESITGVQDGDNGDGNINIITTLATVTASGFDPLAGSLTRVNGEIRAADGSSKTGEVNVSAALTTLSAAMPTTFDGYIMVGNDNYESTSDQGTEYYYTKLPLSYVDQNSVAKPEISTYLEGTITWTGYDDGTTEATLNVTVGTSTVDSTELKMTVSANGAFGNPQLDNAVGVCFNATSSLANWDEVRPVAHAGTFTRPGFLAGSNIVGSCYVLPINGLLDSPSGGVTFYRFYVKLDPNSAVVDDSGLYAIPLDKTYYKDDAQRWTVGWGDESDVAADTDAGNAATSNTKQIIIA